VFPLLIISKKTEIMFGDLLGSFEQKQTEILQKTAAIVAEVEVGGVRVSANGNKEITNISITDTAILADKEQLEDLLMVAINRALTQAGDQAADETQKMMSSILPPGLSGLFGQ
jgi:nucleoid-associated protein EbfC